MFGFVLVELLMVACFVFMVLTHGFLWVVCFVGIWGSVSTCCLVGCCGYLPHLLVPDLGCLGWLLTCLFVVRVRLC